MNEQRWILHLDMDAFYAQVEKLDDESLHNEPVIVGGTGRRGVVSAASYEAREFGVHSAMPMSRARQLCPQAHVRSPRFERYRELSRRIRNVMERFTARIQPVSLDEAYLDGTDLVANGRNPEDIGSELRRGVFEATGLTGSVGAGTGKLIAKLASETCKPNGLKVVKPGDEKNFLAPLPIGDLQGVGEVTEEQFRDLGIETIGDLQQVDPVELRHQFGDRIVIYHRRARGIDPREVEVDREPKSISNETTFEQDIDGRERLMEEFFRITRKVSGRLQANDKIGTTVEIKYRLADFETHTRSHRLNPPTGRESVLLDLVRELVEDHVYPVRQGIRLVGVGVSGLRDADVQTTLFESDERDPDPETGSSGEAGETDGVMEKLNRQVGRDILRPASELET